MVVTPERLAEIRERVAKATAGPWETTGYVEDTDVACVIDRDCDTLAECPGAFAECDENAAFIAAARQDVPDLLAEVGRLSMDTRHLAEWCKALEELVASLFRDVIEDDEEGDRLRTEIGRLRAALEAAKIKHRETKEQYYPCPKHPIEGSRGAHLGPDCDCGAEVHNAAIDAALRGAP